MAWTKLDQRTITLTPPGVEEKKFPWWILGVVAGVGAIALIATKQKRK